MEERSNEHLERLLFDHFGEKDKMPLWGTEIGSMLPGPSEEGTPLA
jgi:hypothetical protein